MLRIKSIIQQAEITVESGHIARARDLIKKASRLNEELAAGRESVPAEYINARLRIRKIRNRLIFDMKKGS